MANLFQEDLKETKFDGIGRFPTLTFPPKVERRITTMGYRTLTNNQNTH